MRKKRENQEQDSQLSRGWTIAERSEEPEHTRAEVLAEVVASEASLSAATNILDPRKEVSNLTLVLFGVFGGMYLLYTVGWFMIAQYFSTVNSITASTSGIIGGVLQQAIFWIAAFAPAGWFLASVYLARNKKAWFLPVALFIGLIVLLPLPLFIVGGGS